MLERALGRGTMAFTGAGQRPWGRSAKVGPGLSSREAQTIKRIFASHRPLFLRKWAR